MDTSVDIAVIVGSLRRESFNRRVAQAMFDLAPPPMRLSFAEIRALPLFNQDDEDRPTAAVIAFKQQIADAQAALVVTPEYNRSIPGVLKNAIDIGTRPKGQNVWMNKPAAVVSVTPGALGAFGANHHLRQALIGASAVTMPKPELYIGGAGSLFDADGNLTNDKTRDLLRNFLTAFASWIERNPQEPR